MGSLFSTNTPSYAPTQSTVVSPIMQTVTDKDEVKADDTSSEENDIRDFVRKSTRSRSATIQTSYRGVLDEDEGSLTSIVPQRKSLLGE